jgi:hypothetical protein
MLRKIAGNYIYYLLYLLQMLRKIAEHFGLANATSLSFEVLKAALLLLYCWS